MKKYLSHIVHGLVVYAAAVVPQLFAEKLTPALLISLAPGLIAVLASAFLPKTDAQLVEKTASAVIQKVAPK